MTSITAITRPTFPSSAASRRLVGEAIAQLRRLAARWRDAPPRVPDWTSLNAHLLEDIGETPDSARYVALRNLFWPPLGSIGRLIEHKTGPRI